MTNEKTKQIIKLLKIVTFAVAIIAWLKMLYEVLQFPGGFGAQAPYCIAGTMLIFGIATGVYKGIEAWERRT